MPSMIDCMICTSICACSHSCACICARFIVLTGARCWVHQMLSKLCTPSSAASDGLLFLTCACAHVRTYLRTQLYLRFTCQRFLHARQCACPCDCGSVCVCMCIPMHRWLGARLWCLQCVSNGDAAVFRRAIDVCTHVCAYTKQQYQATIQDISLNCYMH